MIDISVIVPCYNCAKWIEKCLNALEKQTYKKFEVICIDDCSIDNTYETICKMKNGINYSLQILKNEKNSGPAFSRNRGMKYANGQYLAFCDSDDWYDESFLKDMHDKLVGGEHDLVMCEYRKVFDSERSPVDVHYLRGCSKDKMDLIAFSKAAMPLLIFRKDILGMLEMPDLRNGEDIAFIPCIESKAKSIGFVEKPLYNYRMREGSASKTPNPNVYLSLQEAYAFIESNCADIKQEVLEYIGIKTVLYGATINALKAKTGLAAVLKIKKDFEIKYPEWNKNKYLFLFSKPKLLYLVAIKKERIRVCNALAKIHQRLSF